MSPREKRLWAGVVLVLRHLVAEAFARATHDAVAQAKAVDMAREAFGDWSREVARQMETRDPQPDTADRAGKDQS